MIVISLIIATLFWSSVAAVPAAKAKHNNVTRIQAQGRDLLTTFSQNCSSDQSKCKTCFNDKCYPRMYPVIRSFGIMPLVICESGCKSFYFYEGSVVCSCDNNSTDEDFATREPCLSNEDCSNGATCQNYVCTFSSLPDNLLKACNSHSDCPSDKLCASLSFRCIDPR